MNTPHITIITVCYNSATFIQSTIESVIELGYDNLDYFIIDGGSNDGTQDIIKNYSQHISYFISEPDQGIYDAMNKGWLKADINSYVLFLGSGDRVISLPALSSFNVANVIVGDVNIGDKTIFQPKTDFRLKLGNTLHHQALLVKKEIHPGAPFNLKFETYADFDFNQRILKANHKIAIDPNFKSFAMEGGVSAKFNKVESLAVVNNNFGIFYSILAKIYYRLRHEI